MRTRERLLASILLLAGCRSGSCRPEPVPCDPKNGTCVDEPAEPMPPPVTLPTIPTVPDPAK